MSDTLNFANIQWHDDTILEVCPHEDIEVSAKDIDDLQLLINTRNNPALLLINRLYEYSYSFEALQKIRQLENIAALAMVFTNLSENYVAHVIQGDKNHSRLRLETFLNKDSAIKWLQSLT